MKLARESWLLFAVPAGLLLVGVWWIIGTDSTADESQGAVCFALSATQTRTDNTTTGAHLVQGLGASAASVVGANLSSGAESRTVEPSVSKPGEESPWGIWTGKVLARDGTPIPGAIVTITGRRNLRLGDDSALDSETFKVTVGKDGSILFPMQPGFLYEVSVRAPGFGLEVFDIRGQAAQDLVLDRASALDGRVMVDGPGGTRIPLAGATVTFQNGREWLTVTTDDNGRYVFDGVGAHPAHVQVTDNRYVAQTQSVDSLHPGESSTVNVYLQAGLRFGGEVLNDASGAPVSNVDVSLIDRLTHQVVSQGTTDSMGRFVFFSLIPMREYFVSVTGVGYRTDQPAQILGGGADVTLTVTPTWVLSLRLSISSGAAAGVRVQLSRQDGLPIIGNQTVSTAYSNGEGLLAFGDLSRDLAFRVVIDHPGYATMDIGPVMSSTGTEQTLPVDLVPGRALGGHVFDDKGQPVPFVTVRAQRVDGFPAPPLFTLADSTGAFMFDTLAPGAISLVTFKTGYDNTRVVTTVPGDGAPPSVDLVISSLFPVSGSGTTGW